MGMQYWRGLVFGFLFGTIGLWLLALLALILPFFELLGKFFFAPQRWLASIIAGTEASTFIVLLLFIASGLLYAMAGFLIEFAFRRLRKQ